MPELSDGSSVAGGFSLSVVSGDEGMGEQPAFDSLCRLRPPGIFDGGDGHARYAQAVAYVVPGHVVGLHAEDRRKRARSSAAVGVRKLSDRLGLVAEAPTGDDPSRSGSPGGSGGGG